MWNILLNVYTFLLQNFIKQLEWVKPGIHLSVIPGLVVPSQLGAPVRMALRAEENRLSSLLDTIHTLLVLNVSLHRTTARELAFMLAYTFLHCLAELAQACMPQLGLVLMFVLCFMVTKGTAIVAMNDEDTHIQLQLSSVHSEDVVATGWKSCFRLSDISILAFVTTNQNRDVTWKIAFILIFSTHLSLTYSSYITHLRPPAFCMATFISKHVIYFFASASSSSFSVTIAP